MIELKIPEGINYECTGCGKCCGGWAVPMTQDDYERISAHNWSELSSQYVGADLFRQMKDYELVGSPYSYAIKPGADGHCPFLVDKLCFIHKSFGAQEKPSICQLFPYCFNETPSGVYATVSFYSMGAVNNSGRALLEQREYLNGKWAEFKQLYPDHHPNWSELKLTVNVPLSWDEYLRHEAQLLQFLQDKTLRIEERMLKGSEYLAAQLPNSQAASSAASQDLKHLDRHLLAALQKMYFPVKALGRGEGDFNIFRFLYQVAFQTSKLKFPGRNYSIEELHAFPYPQRDPEMEDLLYRYFYSRIFAKLYFGAGFGQLSLITGFHHLILILALTKLQAKGIALSRGAAQVSYLDLVAAIRLLEKRLGETALDGNAAAAYELLMVSSQKVKRILAHS